MNKQEVFDKVVTHLRAQKVKSLKYPDDPVICAYRGQHGLQCAAGCLIPDSLYSPSMEGKSWVVLLTDFSHLEEKYPWMWKHRYLIQDLQRIHDHIDSEHWELAFQACAKGCGLAYQAP